MTKLAEIGQVQGNTLLLNETPVSTAVLYTFTGLSSETLTPYGTEGSAIKYSSEIGKTYQLNLTAKNPQSVLFSNGIEVRTFKLQSGFNQFTFTANSDSFYLIFLRQFESTTYRSLSVDVQELNPPSVPLSVYTLGSATANNLTQTYNLITKGASVQSLSKSLGIELNLNQASDGSAVIISGLENGKYQFTLNAQTAEPSDKLLAYNGHQLVTLWDSLITPIHTVDLVYGWVALISLDTIKADSNSAFIISNLTKIEEINYPVPSIISLIPDSKQGAIKLTDNETIISNSTGSLLVTDTNFALTIPSNVTNAVEGSYAEWMLEAGDYSIEYYLRTTEKVPNQDHIFYYTGTELILLANRADANIPIGTAGTTFVSNKMTLNVTVTNKLGFAVIDTVTKVGSTELRITAIKKN